MILFVSSKRTEASRVTQLCCNFHFFYSLYKTWKDHLYRISVSEFYKWLFGTFQKRLLIFLNVLMEFWWIFLPWLVREDTSLVKKRYCCLKSQALTASPCVVILFTFTCFDACFLKLSSTVFHWKGRGTFWSPAPCPMLIMYLIWGTLSDVCSVLMFLPGSAFGCCQNSILAILGYLWNFLCALYH